jgi:serpin B
MLRVVGGPVSASGFVWWHVEPISIALIGASRGWVAMADKDGEPWIALAENPIPGLGLAVANVSRLPASLTAAQAAARSITAFGLDHYRRLLEDPDVAARNLVFSPTSIALALGMARAGGRGETAAEMDRVLHVGGWDELAGGLNALDQALAGRDETWTDFDRTVKLSLRIANASFAQRDWKIEQPFLDAIGSVFGSGLYLVDYLANPEAARRAINAWVSNRTEERIPELLAPPDVTAQTRLYLVNAIYLKAEWERWFELGETEAAPFTRLDGSRVDVQTMHRTAGALGPMIPYARGPDWQAVELRYLARPQSPPLAMTLVLPDDLPAFETGLEADQLAQIGDALDAERDRFADPDCPPLAGESGDWCYPYDLSLYLPRFSIDSRAELKEALAAAGMRRAFDPATADFSGIHQPASDGEQLFISAVIHQANIDVDEKGTEAAAATAVGVDTGGGPSPLESITIRFDRPFLFFLRDVETGAVLFMGRVVDPSMTR